MTKSGGETREIEINVKLVDMEEPKISVIVPIYNVEKYVRKCLDSLAAQTMREIEIICVDDGSTDKSGEIAEYYSSNPRFRVIHTENRGLSAARNRGIDESRGVWLMFVDSDDWVDEQFCEVPYKAAIENDADLVCFRSYRVSELGRVKKPKKTDAPIGLVDEMTAHKFGGSIAWNKLYCKSLFKEVKYPEGRVYEEFATTHKLIHESNHSILLKDILYYYVSRKGSITHTVSLTNKQDYFTSMLERYEDLISYGYTDDEFREELCSSALSYLAFNNRGNLYSRAERIVNTTTTMPQSFNYKKKIAFLAWKTNSKLFALIGMAYRYRNI